MKEIKLTLGKIALVDDEDFERLNQHKWTASTRRKTFGACRQDRISGKHVWMHREILEAKPEFQVDHINGNGLDNRRCNLRLCTHSENLCNRGPQKNNSSGFKGVHWNKERGKWHVSIQVNRKMRFIGLFDDIKEAARAYNEAAQRLHGAFAWLNEIS